MTIRIIHGVCNLLRIFSRRSSLIVLFLVVACWSLSGIISPALIQFQQKMADRIEVQTLKSPSSILSIDSPENLTLQDALKSLDSCQARKKEFTTTWDLSEEGIIARTKDCKAYFDQAVSKAEKDFPFAWVSTVHKHIGIWELFLATHMRPVDAHCVHVDQKADQKVFDAVEGIIKCYKERFPNTTFFMTRHNIPVFWGYGASIQEADMICFRDLLRVKHNFKMIANMAGTELPFVSHQKFREMLARAGGNILEIHANHMTHRQRAAYIVKKTGPLQNDVKISHVKGYPVGKPPCELYVYKGLKNGAFSRAFVEFVTSNYFSLVFYNWIYNTGHVCEHFLNTLATLSVQPVTKSNKTSYKITQRFDAGVMEQRDHWNESAYGQKAPDACYKEYLFDGKKNCQLKSQKCPFDPLKKGIKEGIFGAERPWTNNICYRATLWYTSCKGMNRRGICTYSVSDLDRAKRRKCLIGNKFNIDFVLGIQAVFCQIKELFQLAGSYKQGIEQNGVK